MSDVNPIETGIPANRQRDRTNNHVTVTVTEFMSAVVPWPVDNIGHVNLHYSMTNPKAGEPGQDPLLKGMGWSFKNLNTFVQRAAWIPNSTNFRDVWFCTSRQREAAINSKGKPKALRRHANAMDLKAIWIDADVKPDDTSGKHYTSMAEAWAALCAFRRKVGLPEFSAAVNSGGGLHVYWISERALEPTAWLPYAAGLKALLLKEGVLCDAGLTTDDVRLLRVPGTYNHKYDPPREVELLPLPLAKYNFETSLAFLTTVAPALVVSSTSNALVFSAKFQGVKPLTAPMDNDCLSDGIEKREDILLDPRPVFQQCAFMRNAFANGGADLDNPLWNLSVLATIFMENGNEYAHQISKGHATYTPADTQALYDRKVADRANRGIGYPSCAAIAGNGCQLCATCSHFAKSKSPLHLAGPVTATVNPIRTPGLIKAEMAAVRFRDFDKAGQPRPTLANAVIAIRSFGIKIRLDLFHNRTTVSHHGISNTIREGLLTDQTVSAVRSLINNTYRIDCGDPNTFAAINEIGRDNSFDPVLDLLDECQSRWDGVHRLDTWVIDYLGCEDTRLNRAIGRSVLVAACRRARVPGCKFDFITVLEGPEGINKSSAIRVLAGDEYFSDQSILGASDKEVQEQLEGIWMHESADLAGMRRAEVEQVKAFASRQVDRARPAYARGREDRPRRSIEWATTNNEEYLLSQTGNRRWWPLKTGKVDIEALKRDREQLLGEAATYEAAGEHIGLDESLWGDARNVQEQRRVTDPWEDALANMDGNLGVVHRLGDGMERVFSADLLTHVLLIPKPQQTSQHMQRLAQAMKHLGWGRSENGRITIGGVTLRGYIRAIPFNVAQQSAHSEMGIEEPTPQPVCTGICT